MSTPTAPESDSVNQTIDLDAELALTQLNGEQKEQVTTFLRDAETYRGLMSARAVLGTETDPAIDQHYEPPRMVVGTDLRVLLNIAGEIAENTRQHMMDPLTVTPYAAILNQIMFMSHRMMLNAAQGDTILTENETALTSTLAEAIKVSSKFAHGCEFPISLSFELKAQAINICEARTTDGNLIADTQSILNATTLINILNRLRDKHIMAATYLANCVLSDLAKARTDVVIM